MSDIIVQGKLTGSLTNPSVVLEDPDYNNLINKPSINGIELQGDKTFDELGYILPDEALSDEDALTNLQIEAIINSIVM